MASPDNNVQRNTKMGYMGATSYVIGNIIGSGIFITPSSILRQTNSIGLSLIIWVLCALIAILGSLCYIELATSIRESGCDFAYICYVKWYPLAFAFMWVSVLITYPATLAILAETFGQYVIEGVRQVICIDEAYGSCAERLIGFALLWLLTWMNFFSLSKFAARFQMIATIAKLLAVSVIIVTGFYFLIFKGAQLLLKQKPLLFQGWTKNLANPMEGTQSKPGDIVLAIYGGLWAFSGWDVLNYGPGEIKNPKRTVPLALLTGIFIVTIVYLLINISFFIVLDVETMKSTNAVAAVFSQEVLGNFSYAIPFLVGILLCGTLNGAIFSGSRYMFAAAHQGHLPPCFSSLNAINDSPRAAIFAQTAIAIGMSFVGELDKLISYVVFCLWLQRCFTMLALIWIRYRRIPVHKDAVRMPVAFTATFLVVNVMLVIVPCVQAFTVTVLGLVICASGLVLYYLFVWPENLPNCLVAINDAMTKTSAIIFDGLPHLKSESDYPSRRCSNTYQCVKPKPKEEYFLEKKLLKNGIH